MKLLIKISVKHSCTFSFFFCTPIFTYQEVQKPPGKNFSGHTELTALSRKHCGERRNLPP